MLVVGVFRLCKL